MTTPTGAQGRASPVGARLRSWSATLYVDDATGRVGGLKQAVDIGAIASDDVGAQVGGGAGNDGVDYVAGGSAVHQFAGGVGLLFGQGDDVASAQEAVELDLGGGAADLGDDGRGNYRG